MTFIDFAPWPLLLGLTALLFVGVRNRKLGWIYLLGLGLFGLYLLAAANLLFFPLAIPQNWPANLTWEWALGSLRGINLIPFYYGSMFNGALVPKIPVMEIAGNLLLTVPFGFGMCFLTGVRGRRLLRLALLTGLATEGTQLLLKLVTGVYVHAIDINDVILNGLGVLIGAGIYALGLKILGSLSIREKASAR